MLPNTGKFGKHFTKIVLRWNKQSLKDQYELCAGQWNRYSLSVINLNLLVEYILDTMFKQIKFAQHNKALTATNFRPVLSYERKK